MYFVNLFLFLASSFTIGTPNDMARNNIYKNIMLPISPYATCEEALTGEKYQLVYWFKKQMQS